MPPAIAATAIAALAVIAGAGLLWWRGASVTVPRDGAPPETVMVTNNRAVA